MLARLPYQPPGVLWAEANRPMMLDGVNLLVELLLARNKRQSFTDRRDHAQEERG